jgi:hypothetical protein
MGKVEVGVMDQRDLPRMEGTARDVSSSARIYPGMVAFLTGLCFLEGAWGVMGRFLGGGSSSFPDCRHECIYPFAATDKFIGIYLSNFHVGQIDIVLPYYVCCRGGRSDV